MNLRTDGKLLPYLLFSFLPIILPPSFLYSGNRVKVYKKDSLITKQTGNTSTSFFQQVSDEKSDLTYIDNTLI